MAAEHTYIIRKSFTLLVIRLVLIEVLFELIYIAWRFAIDWSPLLDASKIYLHTVTTAVFILVTLFQLISLVILVTRWFQNYYEIQHDEVIVWTGFVTRVSKSYQYANIQSVTVEQSFLGRLLGYGTVRIYIPVFGQDIIFTEVPKPFMFIELLKQRMPKAGNSHIFLRHK